MNKVMNPDIIRESFIETGMYNPISKSYDLNKIMDKHKVKMTEDERLHFVETIPKLAKVIADKGEFNEAALTRVGLPTTTVKDNKTLIQKRTVFLTNKYIVQKELQKISDKNEAKEASLLKTSKKRKTPAKKKACSRKKTHKSMNLSDYSSEEMSSDESDVDYML